jgi:hypothetical protein
MAGETHRIEILNTRVTLWLLMLFSGVAFAAIFLLLPHGSASMNVARVTMPLSVVVACAAAFVLMRRGHARLGAATVVMVAYVGILNYVVVAGYGLHSYAVGLFAILIIITSLLIGHRAGVGAAAIAVATAIVLFLFERAELLVDLEAVQSHPPD